VRAVLAQEGGAAEGEERQARKIRKARGLLLASAALAAPCFAVSMLLPLFPAGAAVVDAHAFASLTVGTLLAWLLATPVQFGCAAGLYRKAYKSLRAGAPGMEVGAPPAGQSLYFFLFFQNYRHPIVSG
jgi:cation transport ATPase